MFTTVAFGESIDEAGAMANLAAIADQHVRTEGDHIIVPRDMNRFIGAVAYLGTVVAQCQLVSPSLRKIGVQSIAPLNQVLVPTGEVVHSITPDSYVPLTPDEQIEIVNNGNPAGAENHTVAVWLSNGDIVPKKGNIRTIRIQVTTAVVALAWTLADIVIVDDLPVGEYEIVGAAFEIASALAFRFVFIGGTWRPGVPVLADVNTGVNDIFRRGKMGSFGTFHTTQLPGIEVLGNDAVGAATYEGVLDILI